MTKTKKTTSATEDFVRNDMRPALRRQYQPIALRLIAEAGGTVDISRIRQAIAARHPQTTWDPRYPIGILVSNGIIVQNGTTVSFTEKLNTNQIASLLAALDERAVRTAEGTAPRSAAQRSAKRATRLFSVLAAA